MTKGGLIHLLFVGFCFLFCFQANAQTQDRPLWLSAGIGHNEYKGDFGNQFFEFGVGDNWTFGTSVDMYLNASFDLGLSFNVGVLEAEKEFEERVRSIDGEREYVGSRVEFFNNTFIKSGLVGRYKFSNGYIFHKNSSVQPYITAGIGITSYTGGERDILNRGVTSDVRDGRVITVPAGAGLNIPVSERVQLYAQSIYHRTFAEGFDGRDKVDDLDHDDYLIHTVGVKVAIWGSRDDDDDGVPDKSDACPNEKGPEILGGCPDQDQDGIEDRNDRCPQIAGVDYADGCPDADGDRVEDSVDKCPKTAGDPKLDGCPDEDGDGITDNVDACPNLAGPEELNGCPDSDGDGVPNGSDACPEIAGPESLNGCPDSDGDGIMDANDKCPNQSGTAERNGCPVKVEDEVQEELSLISKNINFAVGQSTLAASSNEHLDRLVEILKEDENLKLIIEAYTDSEGNASYNLQLSKQRAQAVEQYLIKQGINSERLRTEGYGEILPIASNDTAEGRAKNRRVELRLTYF